VAVAEEQTFCDLLWRVRAGDEAAATELVRRYEPEVRRAIRVRLTDPRLRRVLDSVDVCQSVLANFFVRVTAGEFDLDRPEQLLHLLLAMARNKLLDKARRQHARRRDQRRIEAGADAALDGLQGAEPDPGRVVAGQDLLATVRGLLSDEERYLADQRALGREWADIAGEQGARPDALRKKLSRALDRVTARLGLEEIDHA
jgi:DNA-directed RNA polymerase specialized sigma24 family protein